MMNKGKREAPRKKPEGLFGEREILKARRSADKTAEAPKPVKKAAPAEKKVVSAASAGAARKRTSGGSGGGKRPESNFVWSLKRFCRRHTGLVILGAILALLLCLVLVATAVWKSFVQPPDLPDIDHQDGQHEQIGENTHNDGGENMPGDPLDALPDLDIDEEIPAYVDSQREGVYTFLVLGRSDEDNYTDMIMLVVFDTNTGDVDIASIPRDLMINLENDIKKINSASAGGNVKRMKYWVRKTLGIQPNFYVLVDWQAVGDMVDAVGGVDFYVPFRMHYIDTTPKVGFTIDLEEGLQHLDGDKAMQLIRWRKNNVGTYAPGDSARMELQQQFIKEMAKQFLQMKNLSKIGAFATIFKENVQTDLSIGNLVWFATTALEKNSVSQMTFHSLPGDYENSCWSRTYKDKEKGRYQSYVTLYPKQLIELVNTHLNPYEYQISLSDLDLMSCKDRHIISSSSGVLADTTHDPAYAEWSAVQEGKAYYDKEGNLIKVTLGVVVDANEDGKPDGIDIDDDGKADYTDLDGDGIFDVPEGGQDVPVDPDNGGEGGETVDPVDPLNPVPPSDTPVPPVDPQPQIPVVSSANMILQ